MLETWQMPANSLSSALECAKNILIMNASGCTRILQCKMMFLENALHNHRKVKHNKQEVVRHVEQVEHNKQEVVRHAEQVQCNLAQSSITQRIVVTCIRGRLK